MIHQYIDIDSVDTFLISQIHDDFDDYFKKLAALSRMMIKLDSLTNDENNIEVEQLQALSLATGERENL